MKKKRHKKRKRPRRSRKSAKPRSPASGIQIVTPEGDAFAFTNAHYQHTALDDILQILKQTDEFQADDEPEPDGSFHFTWFETRPGARSMPIGQRVLAHLAVTATTLKVEAMSRQRLDDCCQLLEQLLGDRIHLVEIEEEGLDDVFSESEPSSEPEEPLILPPEVIAELEEKMLRQWIDDSIPALGGMTPREAVKTPEGRKQVLELLEYIARRQQRAPKAPGMFAPDYRKVKKMLGLE
jgi:hypothetical protein